MTSVPLIPDTAPFTPEQRAWLNGFFAGLFSRATPAGAATVASARPPALPPLTILFGSQTGTAEGLAKRAAREAGKRGFAATVVDMAQTGAERLPSERNLLVIASTYGDGEPPDSARALHAVLGAAAAPRLPEVRFSVCGLGDTNYRLFCQCGKDFDERLERLGAVRVAPRADCDLDYEAAFARWLDASLAAFSGAAESPTAGTPVAAGKSPAAPVLNGPEGGPAEGADGGHSKARPFPAAVLTVRALSGAGSGKEVNHVEFSLAGSGLAYEAGDALGVFPTNCPALVAEVLAALGYDGEEAVRAPDGSSVPLRRALGESYDLGKPSAELLALLGAGSAPLPHVIDVLLAHPGKRIPAAEFVGALRKLQPRLYSISSSPKAHVGQVHLTVGAVRYEHAGRRRKGVCSTFLAERALAVGRVGVFVHPNRVFRPPADGSRDMIMVGPGTGIAPFRAFLQERRLTGATGRNWLVFGDQREATDFLYREELLGARADGTLARLDLAWSRDGADKVYVQHRLLAAAEEVWAWLEAGAHFYVCGDASRMAKDVDAALHRVVETAGGRTAEQAADYIQTLRAAKRYVRDVY